MQPYLGAFGHLVALREGALAYLPVRPRGDQPSSGELSGPEVRFLGEAPTRAATWIAARFALAVGLAGLVCLVVLSALLLG